MSDRAGSPLGLTVAMLEDQVELIETGHFTCGRLKLWRYRRKLRRLRRTLAR